MTRSRHRRLLRQVNTELQRSFPLATPRTAQTSALPFFARSARLFDSMIVLSESEAPVGIAPLLRTLAECAFASFYIFADGDTALGRLQRSEYAYRKSILTDGRDHVTVQWDLGELPSGAETTEPDDRDKLGASDLARLAAEALRQECRDEEAASVDSLYKNLFAATSHVGTHATMSNLLDHRTVLKNGVDIGLASLPDDYLDNMLLNGAAIVLHVATWAYAVAHRDDGNLTALQREVHAALG